MWLKDRRLHDTRQLVGLGRHLPATSHRGDELGGVQRVRHGDAGALVREQQPVQRWSPTMSRRSPPTDGVSARNRKQASKQGGTAGTSRVVGRQSNKATTKKNANKTHSMIILGAVAVAGGEQREQVPQRALDLVRTVQVAALEALG
jgi:hypothetical protein